MYRLFCLGIFAGILLTLSSCRDHPVAIEGRAPAKGSVTLDGQPLTGGGTVKFQSVDNPRMRVSVALDENGQFRVSDAPEGKVKITVITTPKIYPEMIPIPKKYSKLKTSALEGTISQDSKPFVIKLKSE